MIPLDTSHIITFWIPLDPIPKGGTGLFFVDKSHADFALPFWNGDDSGRKSTGHNEYLVLHQRYGGERHCVQQYMPLEVGDVTVHSGWTLHGAPSTKGETDGGRYALAVTYVDSRAQVREGAWEELVLSKTKMGKGYNEDRWSFQDWLKDVKPRKYFEHDLVPVVWPKKKKKNGARVDNLE
jgi:ectoine hydroxylase-related dioxygenase (phytanoyl-CoA dioxygenase family)